VARLRVAIAAHPQADPRSAPPGTAPHLLHDEIPSLEEAVAACGWEPLLVPLASPRLEALSRLAGARPDVVLNLAEDLDDDPASEEQLAGALGFLGVPCTGAPPLALGLCRDKVLAKRVAASLGVPTPAWVETVPGGATATCGLALPLFVKPAVEDGGLGVDDGSLCEDAATAREVAARVAGRWGRALVEEFVAGRELNVPVLGGGAPRVLPISEIDFSGLPPGRPRVVGYAAKWEPADERFRGTAAVCPAPLDGQLRLQLERWSLRLYAALGLRGCARLDWRVCPERGPFFLEANPNPDLGATAGYVRSLRAAGLGYPDLVAALVEDALRGARGGGR